MNATALANIVSKLLHPPLVLVAGALVLAYTHHAIWGIVALFVLVGMGPGLAMDIGNYLRVNTKRSVLDKYLGYVLGFALLAVVYGSEIIADLRWMYLAMAIAIFFCLVILVEKYFLDLSVHAAVLVFWCTVLMDKVSPKFFLGFLLLLPLMLAEKRLRKHASTAILWGLTVGVAAGLFTWL